MRFATPEEHGTPEGHGAQGEPADQEDESSKMREDVPGGEKGQSLDIMLKIVQGMQIMQEGCSTRRWGQGPQRGGEERRSWWSTERTHHGGPQ